jgi:hypothetical protein
VHQLLFPEEDLSWKIMPQLINPTELNNSVTISSSSLDLRKQDYLFKIGQNDLNNFITNKGSSELELNLDQFAASLEEDIYIDAGNSEYNKLLQIFARENPEQELGNLTISLQQKDTVINDLVMEDIPILLMSQEEPGSGDISNRDLYHWKNAKRLSSVNKEKGSSSQGLLKQDYQILLKKTEQLMVDINQYVYPKDGYLFIDVDEMLTDNVTTQENLTGESLVIRPVDNLDISLCNSENISAYVPFLPINFKFEPLMRDQNFPENTWTNCIKMSNTDNTDIALDDYQVLFFHKTSKSSEAFQEYHETTQGSPGFESISDYLFVAADPTNNDVQSLYFNLDQYRIDNGYTPTELTENSNLDEFLQNFMGSLHLSQAATGRKVLYECFVYGSEFYKDLEELDPITDNNTDVRCHLYYQKEENIPIPTSNSGQTTTTYFNIVFRSWRNIYITPADTANNWEFIKGWKTKDDDKWYDYQYALDQAKQAQITINPAYNGTGTELIKQFSPSQAQGNTYNSQDISDYVKCYHFRYFGDRVEIGRLNGVMERKHMFRDIYNKQVEITINSITADNSLLVGAVAENQTELDVDIKDSIDEPKIRNSYLTSYLADFFNLDVSISIIFQFQQETDIAQIFNLKCTISHDADENVGENNQFTKKTYIIKGKGYDDNDINFQPDPTVPGLRIYSTDQPFVLDDEFLKTWLVGIGQGEYQTLKLNVELEYSYITISDTRAHSRDLGENRGFEVRKIYSQEIAVDINRPIVKQPNVLFYNQPSFKYGLISTGGLAALMVAYYISKRKKFFFRK